MKATTTITLTLDQALEIHLMAGSRLRSLDVLLATCIEDRADQRLHDMWTRDRQAVQEISDMAKAAFMGR